MVLFRCSSSTSLSARVIVCVCLGSIFFYIYVLYYYVRREDEGKFHKASPVCLACLPWPLHLASLSRSTRSLIQFLSAVLPKQLLSRYIFVEIQRLRI